MWYMEMNILSGNGLRIRSKKGTIGINSPLQKEQFNGVILIGQKSNGQSYIEDEMVVIDGPGDYEVAGLKISGTRNKEATVYSLIVDNVEILIGDIQALSDAHQKLKEHHLLVILADQNMDTSFATSLASKAIVLYGEKAGEVVHTFAKEGVKEMAKYQATLEKLPLEMETILLT
jgi:hypothetical protein